MGRDESGDTVAIAARIDELAERAATDQQTFEPPVDPPDPERAKSFLIDGAGEAVWLYAHARTGGRLYPFSEEEWNRLEGAMNTWFRLYAACYGEDINPRVTLRTAAEALVDTNDIVAVARTVTGVPDEPF